MPLELPGTAFHYYLLSCTHAPPTCTHTHARARTLRSTLQSPTWLLCITILGSAGLTYVLIYTVYTASRTFTQHSQQTLLPAWYLQCHQPCAVHRRRPSRRQATTALMGSKGNSVLRLPTATRLPAGRERKQLPSQKKQCKLFCNRVS